MADQLSNAEVSRRWREKNPGRWQAIQRKSRLKVYGLNEATYQALYNYQGGLCAICKKNRKLTIDHDHHTGRVRGLLCNPCNGRLGWLEGEWGLAAGVYLGS